MCFQRTSSMRLTGNVYDSLKQESDIRNKCTAIRSALSGKKKDARRKVAETAYQHHGRNSLSLHFPSTSLSSSLLPLSIIIKYFCPQICAKKNRSAVKTNQQRNFGGEKLDEALLSVLTYQFLTL